MRNGGGLTSNTERVITATVHKCNIHLTQCQTVYNNVGSDHDITFDYFADLEAVAVVFFCCSSLNGIAKLSYVCFVNSSIKSLRHDSLIG